ncbi:hypothetical protein KC678_05310 [Candidatus Dojkabacteria bacterium]|uniref:Uncharacterized protein n=1 Tax=Candidatus Dojkabacteria bacterium TaxID=2099670 RepID=A0A955RH63_9BACT|nr:hypothetical protein [Candidatus Dojkabacteria bacterium]
MESNTMEDSAMQDSLNSAVAEVNPKPIKKEDPKMETHYDPKRNSKPLLIVIVLLAIVGIVAAIFVVFSSMPKSSENLSVVPESSDETLDSENFTLETDQTASIDTEDKSSNEQINDTISDLDTFFGDLNSTNDFEDLNINYDE